MQFLKMHDIFTLYVFWYCYNDSIVFSDKVSNVDIDLQTKKVIVTSTLSSDELLETLKKTGKEVTYVGGKAA